MTQTAMCSMKIRSGGGNGSSCDEDTGRVIIYHDYKNEDWHKILIDPAKVAKVKVNNVEIPLK